MKRTKKSQKKTKFLLILIVLTAILSITATYAWFSTQKDVEISTLRLNIEVAESLEISLNGKEWANKITISDMRQLYGTAASGHQASKYVNAESGSGNTNYVPKELLPVSTVGTVSDGKLQFMRSSSFSGTTLNAIPCSEADLLAATAIGGTDGRESKNAEHPYLVFDMYLKNLSAQNNGDDLRLATGSRVWADTVNSDAIAGVSKAGTGAENAMRVGFVQYMQTMDATTADATGSQARALTPNYTPTGEGATEQTAKVAIWEPNDLDHIQEVVNNNSRVSSVSETAGVITVTRENLPTYTLVEGTSNGTVKFNGTDIAVHGLKSAAYTEASAYDVAGAAAAVLGSDSDTKDKATVYGVKAHATDAATTAKNEAVDHANSLFEWEEL